MDATAYQAVATVLRGAIDQADPAHKDLLRSVAFEVADIFGRDPEFAPWREHWLQTTGARAT